MTGINVTSETQRIVVTPGSDRINIVKSGPPGPPGPPGPVGFIDDVGITEAIDIKIAVHDQSTPVHTQATSGRDFSALFLNGLV